LTNNYQKSILKTEIICDEKFLLQVIKIKKPKFRQKRVCSDLEDIGAMFVIKILFD